MIQHVINDKHRVHFTLTCTHISYKQLILALELVHPTPQLVNVVCVKNKHSNMTDIKYH